MNKKYVIQFNMDESEIRKNFLDWVILGDNTPIDIAYKAEITSVTKTFYPIRMVSSEYKAEWSALSIWEREEEYTEQVLYIKYQYGHNTNGVPQYATMEAEKYYKNPNYGPCVDKFYKPIKKTRTVIDKKERTSGHISGNYCSKVTLTEDNNDELINWLNSISLETSMDFSESAVMEAKLKPLTESDEYAHDYLAPSIKKQAISECKKEVPGTRYEEFSLEHMSDKYVVNVYYVPVYEITYKYGDKEYNVLMSGSVKESAFAVEKPIDTNLEEKKKKLDSELEALKSERLKYGLIGFLGPIVTYILTAFFRFDDGVYYIIFALLVAAGAFVVVKKFLPLNKKVKEQNNIISVYLGNLDEKKKTILAIVNNDSLSAEEQKEPLSTT